MIEVYTDGGLAKSNPSKYGGAWAFVLVEDGLIQHQESGAIYAHGTPVTNNMVELMAVVEAYDHLMQATGGTTPRTTLYCDSSLTIQRVFHEARLNGIPAWLSKRLGGLLRQRAFVLTTPVLIKGHPSRAELAAGVAKGGLPVSRWNVLADRLCTEKARELLEAAR
jgi:hypothetical protein